MNKTFNNLIESILEAGYKCPASLKETDWDDPTERYWDKSPVDITPQDNSGNYKDSRQVKKDKIIKRRQDNIDKSQQQLNDWLNKMALRDDINIIAIENQRVKYQAKIDKRIQELEGIKKLPLIDPLFN